MTKKGILSAHPPFNCFHFSFSTQSILPTSNSHVYSLFILNSHILNASTSTMVRGNMDFQKFSTDGVFQLKLGGWLTTINLVSNHCIGMNNVDHITLGMSTVRKPSNTFFQGPLGWVATKIVKFCVL